MPDLPPRFFILHPLLHPQRGRRDRRRAGDPTKISYGVMRNLTDPEHSYREPDLPINPKADEILGLRCYPDPERRALPQPARRRHPRDHRRRAGAALRSERDHLC